MTAIATITISDGAGSPVSHVFTPIGRDEKGVMWLEQTTPTPTNVLGAKRLGYKHTRDMNPKNQLTGRSVVDWSLAYPTLETLGTSDSGLTPPPTVAYITECRTTFRLPDRASAQECKDVRVLMKNLYADTQFISTIDARQPLY